MEGVYHAFQASYSPDPNVRIAAELELRKLEPLEGLIPTLLQLVSPASSASPVVRLAASIYLKNRVKSSWRKPAQPSAYAAAKSNASPYTPIPPSDKQSLKTNVLPLLSALASDPASNPVKLQIAEVLQKVIEGDFPAEWPGLMDEIVALLAGNEGQVEAGLRASMSVFSSLRYNRSVEDETTLPALVTHLLPQLLQLSQRILAPTPTDAASLALQGSLAYLIVKSYKNSILYALTEAHQAHESIVPWGSLLLQIVQREIPVALLPEDLDDREKHPWSKCKKWACFALNRLFDRYGNPSQLPSNMKVRYGPFAERFIAQFAPEIIKAYLVLIQRIVEEQWQPRKVKHYILSFLEETIKPKATWAIIKPHIFEIIQRFAYPLICLTEEEIEQFSEDPQEFARTHFGDFIAEAYNSPTASALSFISTLVELRTAHTLKPILSFIQDIASKYPNETTPRHKDGALRILASLASTAVKAKKIAPMMESFFTTYVLPDFKSPHGFLRYRVCEVVEKYESCDMKWEKRTNLEATLRAVMECVTDSELPVRIQAAITLPELVRYEDIRASMVPNIGRIIQELLKLSNEVDLDALTNTTRSLVSEFQEEVTPFAVELTQSLTDSYSRLIRETLEARERQTDDSVEYDDEKVLVQMNVLKTIDQLISSLDGSADLLDKVEAIITPALEVTLRNNLVELYDEVFEILDSITFFQKKINPGLWPVFEATYATFKSDASDYVHEMSGFLDNCVAYGGAVLSANPDYRKMLLDFYNTVMTSRSLGAEDRCVGCKLAEAMLLNLRGDIDEGIPSFVEHSMAFVLSQHGSDEDFITTRSLFLHSLEVVITATLYNPQLTLAILDSHDWTQQFFGHWFKSLSKLTRVHDKKMSIEAICVLLEWIALNPGTPLAQSAGQLVVGALQIFKDLPEALANKKEQERDFAEGRGEDDEDELGDDAFDDEEFDLEDEGEEGDVRDATTDYLEQLAQSEARRAAAASGDGANGDDDLSSLADSTWSDEVLWISPLDKLDAYVRFTTVLTTLERAHAELFANVTSGLSGELRSELEGIGRRAGEGGEKAGEAEAQAAAA